MPKALKWMLPLLALVVVVAGATYGYRVLTAGPEGAGMQAPVTTTTAAVAADTQAGEATTQAESQHLKARDFTVYETDGTPVALSDFFGKPIVLNFWASWCGPCQLEMPYFQKVYDELGEDVVFLMVNLTDGGAETAETALAFIEESGYTFPVYLDTDTVAAYNYGISSIPQTFVFDSNGYLAGYQQGMLSEAGLRTGVQMAYDQAAQTHGLE